MLFYFLPVFNLCFYFQFHVEFIVVLLFKAPPPVGAGGGYIGGGGYMFSGRPSVRASVRDSRGSFMFLRYLQYLLIDFRQTFVTDASWDTDDLITFLGRKVKGQGHTIAAEAHSTRRYRRVQLFLVIYFAHGLRRRQVPCPVGDRVAPSVLLHSRGPWMLVFSLSVGSSHFFRR